MFAETNVEDVELSTLVAETMGLHWRLLWAEHHQLMNLIIEMDAESVVKVCTWCCKTCSN
jgi:hypothetical protein